MWYNMRIHLYWLHFSLLWQKQFKEARACFDPQLQKRYSPSWPERQQRNMRLLTTCTCSWEAKSQQEVGPGYKTFRATSSDPLPKAARICQSSASIWEPVFKCNAWRRNFTFKPEQHSLANGEEMTLPRWLCQSHKQNITWQLDESLVMVMKVTILPNPMGEMSQNPYFNT